MQGIYRGKDHSFTTTFVQFVLPGVFIIRCEKGGGREYEFFKECYYWKIMITICLCVFVGGRGVFIISYFNNSHGPLTSGVAGGRWGRSAPGGTHLGAAFVGIWKVQTFPTTALFLLKGENQGETKIFVISSLN